jgi:hypothetical protein
MKNSKRIILYQKYKDASDKIADPFWKEIFIKLSYGKVPSGFIVNDNTISFRRRRKIIDSFPIPHELDESSTKQVIEFIRKYSGIRSKIDLELEEKFVEKNKIAYRKISETPWKIMKKNKKLINILTFNFMIREVRTKKLNYKEKLELARIIKLGMTIDLFKGFIFNEKEEVIGIEGLEYDENKRTYRFSDLESINNITESENNETNSAEHITESKESITKESVETEEDETETKELDRETVSENEYSKENESSESSNILIANSTKRRTKKRH